MHIVCKENFLGEHSKKKISQIVERFFDRTSYKPSSSPDEIVLHGRGVLFHVTPYRYFSNKMTPKDHLAAGPTAKVVVLKDLSNRTYPNLANLKLTFLETKK